MKRSLVFTKDKKIVSRGEIDIRQGEFVVESDFSGGGGSGANADWNVNDPDAPGYVKNRPMSKSESQEEVVIGSADSYINYENLTSSGDNMVKLIIGKQTAPIPLDVKKDVLYASCVSVNEDEQWEDNYVNTGYRQIQLNDIIPLYYIFADVLGDRYVTSALVSFKASGNITNGKSLALYMLEQAGLDPETAEIGDYLEHKDEILAVADEFLYKIFDGFLVYNPAYYDEDEGADVEIAFLVYPSQEYLDVWNPDWDHDFAPLSVNPARSYTDIYLYPTEIILGEEPSQEEINAFYDKIYDAHLSYFGMEHLYDDIVTTVEYQKIDENYLPDDIKMVFGSHRVVGTVPAYMCETGEDLPIFEYAGIFNLEFKSSGTSLIIHMPESLQAAMDEALELTDVSNHAYSHIEVVSFSIYKSAGSPFRLHLPSQKADYGSEIQISDGLGGGATVTIGELITHNGLIDSYLELNYESTGTITAKAFIVMRLYLNGAYGDGTA